MLKSMRNHTKIVIWIVVVSFMLWGGFSVGLSFKKSGRFAGEIFGKDVTHQEFNLFYRAAQLFSASPERAAEPGFLRFQTWQDIMYSREAKRQKIKVSDDEVRAEIYKLFRNQGIDNLTTEMYENWLQNTVRETPVQFESQIREIIRIRKLLHKFKDEPLPEPTDEEVLKVYLDMERKTKFSALQFDTKESADEFFATLGEVKGFAQALAKKQDLKVVNHDFMTALEFSQKVGLSPNDTELLFKMGQGEASLPVTIDGTTYFIFFATGKAEGSEENLSDELRADLKTQMTAQNEQRRIVQWSMKLMREAQIIDYSVQEQG